MGRPALSLTAAPNPRSWIPDFTGAAGEILFVINFSLEIRAQKTADKPLLWWLTPPCLFFVLYLFEVTVIRATAGQGSLEKSPSPSLLTDPSVLHQMGAQLQRCPQSLEGVTNYTSWAPQIWSHFRVSVLIRQDERQRIPPTRPAPRSQFSLLPPPGARGVSGASRRPPSWADTSGCPMSASQSLRAPNQSKWINGLTGWN